jgi:hypothetical protein
MMFALTILTAKKRYAKSLLYPLFIGCLTFHLQCKKPDKEVPVAKNDAPLNVSFENNFVRYKKGQAYSGQPQNTWSDTAWKNDRIHKQIIVWSTNDINQLSYQISDLVATGNVIDKNNIQLRCAGYAYGDNNAVTCGSAISRGNLQIADALLAQPVTAINASEPSIMWVTINVPKNAVAGTYSGTITIKSGNQQLSVLNIKVLVVNKTLPDPADWAFHLDIWQFPFQYLSLCTDISGNKILPFSTAHFNLIQPFYQLLANAGQKCISTYIKDGAFLPGQTMVQWIKNTDGTWSFDFTNFDAYVTHLMAWGINKQINAYSLAGWNTQTGYYDAASQKNKTMELATTSPDYSITWNSFLNAFKAHLDTKGWFDKTVLYMDEVPDEQMTTIINVISNNNRNWKIGLAGKGLTTANENALYEYATIWGYKRKSSNAVATFYTSCSQLQPNSFLTMQNNPAELTFLPLYAAANGMNGYTRWAYDYWTLPDPFDIRDGNNAAGDYNLIYRSNNSQNAQPIASIRWELLRQGVQDYEKISLLNSEQVNASLTSISQQSGNDAAQKVQSVEALLKKVSTN